MALAKGDFIGCAAAREESAQGSKRQRVGFVVDADDADAIGDEAVWCNGAVVGWITSGGYCHSSACSYATGYVESALLVDVASAKWEIEILGEMRSARLQLTPLFDPQGIRMTA